MPNSAKKTLHYRAAGWRRAEEGYGAVAMAQRVRAKRERETAVMHRRRLIVSLLMCASPDLRVDEELDRRCCALLG
jgi:hypothetical protein